LNIIFFGDSISYGQLVNKDKTWVERLKRKVENKNINIINSSVCGDTTRLALLRIHHWVQELKPDIVFIQFGINDSNYWQTDKGLQRVSERSFKANIEEIVVRVKHFNTKKIFLLTNLPTLKILKINNKDIHQNIGVKKYNIIIRNCAKELNITLIDIEEVLKNMNKDLETYLLDDGVHLSEEGHDFYYKCVYPYIEDAIDELVKKSGDK